jgi:hypothetical protein
MQARATVLMRQNMELQQRQSSLERRAAFQKGLMAANRDHMQVPAKLRADSLAVLTCDYPRRNSLESVSWLKALRGHLQHGSEFDISHVDAWLQCYLLPASCYKPGGCVKHQKYSTLSCKRYMRSVWRIHVILVK